MFLRLYLGPCPAEHPRTPSHPSDPQALVNPTQGIEICESKRGMEANKLFLRLDHYIFLFLQNFTNLGYFVLALYFSNFNPLFA